MPYISSEHPRRSDPEMAEPPRLLDQRVIPQGVSRADFLRGVAATTLAAALAPRLLPGVADAAEGATPSLSPLQLRFSVVEQFRPFDLLPRRFVQVSERFDGASAFGGLQVEGRTGRAMQEGNALKVRSAGAAPTLFRTGGRPLAPYATAIVSVGTTVQSGGGEAAVLAGLVRDARNYVVASFDAGQGTVAIDVMAAGTRTRVASADADLTGPARFAFVVNENYVTALVGNATSWTPVVQFRVTELVDLRDPAILREYRYGFGASGEDAVIDITGFEAGYFGEAGLRDPHVVSYSDGTPYIRGNKLYFTATSAGLSFFQAAHCGVWTLDLDDPSRIEQTAQLFFARDGLVLGDHAGQIVIDEEDGGFHVAMSSWGDFDFEGVHVRYVRTFQEVLSGVHVLETAKMPLPTDVSSWDPAMVRIDQRWYVAFVESPYQDPVRGFDFHPALSRSAVGGRITQLSKVGADLSRGETEGVILQKIGGRWYLLASDGDDRQYRVYDLRVRLLGFLNAPYGTNIPHPQIVPIAQGGRTTYLMLTFNGTQYFEPLLGYGTHGDFIVMRASPVVRGYEFEPGRGRASGKMSRERVPEGREAAPA